MIIVDKREKNSFVIAELLSKNAEIKLELLDVADYVIGDIGIERKTINDFINSMLNKRLLRQLEELKQYNRQLLIVEGDYEQLYGRGKLNDNAIRGMLLSIIFDFNIPVIFTRDSEDTANFLILLDKKLNKKPREISLKAKKRAYSLAEQMQFIVEGFPSIGPSLARQLLKKFKTIKALANASLPELESVPKLGKKRAKLLHDLINMPYPE